MDRDNECTSTELIPVFEGDEMNFLSSKNSREAGRDENLPDGVYEFVGDVPPKKQNED